MLFVTAAVFINIIPQTLLPRALRSLENLENLDYLDILDNLEMLGCTFEVRENLEDL